MSTYSDIINQDDWSRQFRKLVPYSKKELTVPQQFDYIASQLSGIKDEVKALTKAHYDEIKDRDEEKQSTAVRLTRIEEHLKYINENDRIEAGKKEELQRKVEVTELRLKAIEDVVGWGKWLAGAVGAAVLYILSQAVSQVFDWFKK